MIWWSERTGDLGAVLPLDGVGKFKNQMTKEILLWERHAYRHLARVLNFEALVVKLVLTLISHDLPGQL